MDFTLSVTIKAGSDLVSKDINGKSDPYINYGLLSAAGEWVGKHDTTSVKPKTLNPTWTSGNRAILRSNLGKADALKFEVWDEDKIGKDEFMGEAIVKLSTLQQDEDLNGHQTRTLNLDLQPRANKKDKVSGKISISYSYLTSEKEKELIKQKEEEERKRTEEAKLKAEKEAKERAEVVDALMKSLPVGESSEGDSAKIRALAEKVVAKSGKRITDKKVLKAVLVDVGMWDRVKRYALWANDLSKGFDDLPTSAAVQAAVSADAGNLEAEMDRAWNIFDNDGDGFVDPREIMICLAILSADFTPANRAAFFFDVFDSDKNGELDSREILHLFEADWKQAVAVTLACVQAMLAEKLPAYRHKLGPVMTTLRNKLNTTSVYPGKMVASLLRKCDTDKSGTISKEEFVAFSSNDAARHQVQEELKEIIKSVSTSLEPDLTRELEKMLRY